MLNSSSLNFSPFKNEVLIPFWLKFLDVEAVPKKILDLMNEEKLTRENVASHLQV